MTVKDDILSAEFALGLLDGPEAARVERRISADPAFARMVQDWEDDFAPAFAAAPDHVAPAHVLNAVRITLFGRPPERAASAGLPWGRIIGGILAVKITLAATVLGWNAYWTERVQLVTPHGPAELTWHSRQGRIRLDHAGPEELHIWTEGPDGPLYLGAEGVWISSGLKAGSVLDIATGRPGQMAGPTSRIVLGETG